MPSFVRLYSTLGGTSNFSKSILLKSQYLGLLSLAKLELCMKPGIGIAAGPDIEFDRFDQP
jgi:hypothetical protein